MHDPWAGLRTTGTWADHASYSLGGIDKPLGYGTELVAPAAGVLHTSGRPRDGAEFQCGWVGSAGRRSILMLDHPIERVADTSDAEMLGWYVESDDPMVAIVFQHQSRFGVHGHHYDEGDDGLGWSGASANFNDWGGDVHLHWHGLTASGERVNPLAYIGAAPAGIDIKETDMAHEYPRRTDYRKSIALKPKASTRLKLPNGADMDLTSSGDSGRALITSHVYAKAAPGEAVDLVLIWYDIDGGRGSTHFVERCVADKGGTINASVTHQGPKATGYRIYLQATAPSSNTQPVTISVLAADACMLR